MLLISSSSSFIVPVMLCYWQLFPGQFGWPYYSCVWEWRGVGVWQRWWAWTHTEAAGSC